MIGVGVCDVRNVFCFVGAVAPSGPRVVVVSGVVGVVVGVEAEARFVVGVEVGVVVEVVLVVVGVWVVVLMGVVVVVELLVVVGVEFEVVGGRRCLLMPRGHPSLIEAFCLSLTSSRGVTRSALLPNAACVRSTMG